MNNLFVAREARFNQQLFDPRQEITQYTCTVMQAVLYVLCRQRTTLKSTFMPAYIQVSERGSQEQGNKRREILKS